MEVTKLNVKARCDMHLCRGPAIYKVAGVKGFGGSGLYLCSNCLTELYEALGRVIVPKSPDNLIKKAVKRREEDERN